MKKLALVALVVISFASCLKTESQPESAEIYVPMNFVSVQTPDTAAVGDTVLAYVTVSGANTCYKFAGFNGSSTGSEQYDIRAVGTGPNPNYGTPNPNCLNITITKDTFLTILPKIKGRLIFRYLNSDQLFRADTVVVE